MEEERSNIVENYLNWRSKRHPLLRPIIDILLPEFLLIVVAFIFVCAFSCSFSFALGLLMTPVAVAVIAGIALIAFVAYQYQLAKLHVEQKSRRAFVGFAILGIIVTISFIGHLSPWYRSIYNPPTATMPPTALATLLASPTQTIIPTSTTTPALSTMATTLGREDQILEAIAEYESRVNEAGRIIAENGAEAESRARAILTDLFEQMHTLRYRQKNTPIGFIDETWLPYWHIAISASTPIFDNDDHLLAKTDVFITAYRHEGQRDQFQWSFCHKRYGEEWLIDWLLRDQEEECPW
jgi:hypothetical protein